MDAGRWLVISALVAAGCAGGVDAADDPSPVTDEVYTTAGDEASAGDEAEAEAAAADPDADP